MKKIVALLWTAMMLMGVAWAEEQLEYVEPAGDGSEFTDSPESLICSAMEIYSWFVMWPLDVNEDMPSADGTVYRLLDERFCQKAEMDALLSQYFCDDIQAEMWNWGAYREIDGVLYAPIDGAWRMMDERIENVSYALTAETADQRSYSVMVSYGSDGQETLTYVQDLIDGTWQFTQFPFFW